MPRASAVCSRPGCPNITKSGQCESCRGEAEQRRGSSTERGYGRTPEHRAFRAAVLDRDPICVLCHVEPSVIADHFPQSRRELVASDLDPNDPRYGRGLCRPCDGRQTAQRQPGGWNQRQ